MPVVSRWLWRFRCGQAGWALVISLATFLVACLVVDANNKTLKGNDLRKISIFPLEDTAFGKSMEIKVHRHEES